MKKKNKQTNQIKCKTKWNQNLLKKNNTIDCETQFVLNFERENDAYLGIHEDIKYMYINLVFYYFYNLNLGFISCFFSFWIMYNVPDIGNSDMGTYSS